MNRNIILCVAVILLVAATLLLGQNVLWSLVNAWIRREFPEVERISTRALADWLTSAAKDRPILLDVRMRAEFEVSHLPEARRVEPSADAKSISLLKDQAIVTYCSVGYRSAVFARRLREAGYKQVVNLEGSIFRWANEDRPLVHAGQLTNKVHPYDRVWGWLLKKSSHALNSLPAN